MYKRKRSIHRQNRTVLNNSAVRGKEKSRKLIARLLSTNVENYQALMQLIKIVLIIMIIIIIIIIVIIIIIIMIICDFIYTKYLYNILIYFIY